jgi:hypothetical protein
MFTDIKGYTDRSSRQTRNELEELLDLHDRLIRPIFLKFRGTVIKTIGDAFLVTFESPTNAVLCGMAIQRRLRGHNAKASNEALEVRVAINSGEVSVRENDVFGQPVNIAARVEGLADANEIYFTEAVYLSMNKNEIPSAEIGYRHLKGIPHEIKVYKVLWETGAGTPSAPVPAVKSSSAETMPVSPAQSVMVKKDYPTPVILLIILGALMLAKPVIGIVAGLGDFAKNLFAGPGGILCVALYFYYSFCLYELAEHFKVPRSWMACVPLLNIFYPITIAERPWWWYVTYLVPGLNVVMIGLTWAGLSKRAGVPARISLFIFVPVLNFFVPKYLLAKAMAKV